VLGHEGAGTVAALGPGVSEFAEGDPVVIGWPSACTASTTWIGRAVAFE